MSTAVTVLVAYAAACTLAALALLLLFRHPKRPYLAARWDDDANAWVNEAEHDVGPDNLRLIEDLEAHLKAYGDAVADYYDTTTGD